MSNYYIKDDIARKMIFKNTVPEIVSYLENMCQQINKVSRKEFMIEMVSLGHGYDDANGAYFTELMSKTVDVGIVTKGGRLKRCNIHEHERNSRYKNEMGD